MEAVHSLKTSEQTKQATQCKKPTDDPHSKRILAVLLTEVLGVHRQTSTVRVI
jgi:hypothetical protein